MKRSVRFRGQEIEAAAFLGLLVFDLKTVVPLVGTWGHEWVPDAHPKGAKRSGALGAKRRVVGRALVAQSDRRGGELNECLGRRPQPYFMNRRNTRAT